MSNIKVVDEDKDQDHTCDIQNSRDVPFDVSSKNIQEGIMTSITRNKYIPSWWEGWNIPWNSIASILKVVSVE